jgi:hypothetical protein
MSYGFKAISSSNYWRMAGWLPEAFTDYARLIKDAHRSAASNAYAANLHLAAKEPEKALETLQDSLRFVATKQGQRSLSLLTLASRKPCESRAKAGCTPSAAKQPGPTPACFRDATSGSGFAIQPNVCLACP